MSILIRDLNLSALWDASSTLSSPSCRNIVSSTEMSVRTLASITVTWEAGHNICRGHDLGSVSTVNVWSLMVSPRAPCFRQWGFSHFQGRCIRIWRWKQPPACCLRSSCHPAGCWLPPSRAEEVLFSFFPLFCSWGLTGSSQEEKNIVF